MSKKVKVPVDVLVDTEVEIEVKTVLKHLTDADLQQALVDRGLVSWDDLLLRTWEVERAAEAGDVDRLLELVEIALQEKTGRLIRIGQRAAA